MTPQVIADLLESRYFIQALKKMGGKVAKKVISPDDYVVGEGFAVKRTEEISQFLDDPF